VLGPVVGAAAASNNARIVSFIAKSYSFCIIWHKLPQIGKNITLRVRFEGVFFNPIRRQLSLML